MKDHEGDANHSCRHSFQGHKSMFFYPDVTDITLFPFDVVVSEFTMKTEKNVNEGKTMPCQIKEQMRLWSKTLESIRRPDAESCFEKDCFLVTQR